MQLKDLEVKFSCQFRPKALKRWYSICSFSGGTSFTTSSVAGGKEASCPEVKTFSPKEVKIFFAHLLSLNSVDHSGRHTLATPLITSE